MYVDFWSNKPEPDVSDTARRCTSNLSMRSPCSDEQTVLPNAIKTELLAPLGTYVGCRLHHLAAELAFDEGCHHVMPSRQHGSVGSHTGEEQGTNSCVAVAQSGS